MITYVRRKLRTKFAVRKCHTVEDRARIFFARCDTFLIGNTVFRSIHKKLSRSYKSDYREETERYGKEAIAIVEIIADRRFKLTNYVLGKITATAATVSGQRKLIEHLDVKDDRISRFNDCNGRRVTRILHFPTAANVACFGMRPEDVDVLFSTEEYYLFINSCHALKFHGLIIADAGFKSDLDIISDIYRVKSAIESYGVNTDVSPRDARIFCSDISCSCNDILAVITYINS